MRLRIIAPTGSISEQVVTVASVRFGRDPACEVPFDPDAYPMVSGRHSRIERTTDGGILTPLSRSNQTLLNDWPVEGPVAVQAGDRIRLGVTGPTIEIVAFTPLDEASSPAAPSGVTIQAAPQHLALLRGTVPTECLTIGRGGVIGRVKGHAEFVLEHPHVSQRHARLSVVGGRVLVHDLGSANGTFVNGRHLTRQVELRPGDRIDIGPFSLKFDGDHLVSRSRSNNIELAARKVCRIVQDRASGTALPLLHDIDLVIHPREFVCLLGPSGSGKTMLLTTLSGRGVPDRGMVLVNGESLYANFAAQKQDIAVVPQQVVLHDSLTVAAALGYTAELRLPPDTSRDEIARTIADILDVVGLGQRHGTLLRHLSGGQVKRASLANELLARPSLLFLDEVTSGLDEETDREMMELFRQLADSGKTVVCVTHSLANVEATCHLVAILTAGGRLAFVGTPAEAHGYFGIDRLGDVYKKLAERKPEDWQRAFKTSPLHARYLRDRLPAVPAEDRPATRTAEERTWVNPLRQAAILTRRYLAIWGGDHLALLAMLGQALLVALLLGAVFGRLDSAPGSAQRTLNLLFLLNVSCFWFGCNNAAKELVKERLIYSRERDFNLRIDSYLASKLVVLVLIALVQVTLLFGIVKLWCGPPGAAMAQWGVLAMLAVAGTTLGLLISALARTEEMAAALVPVVVLPQIILAGVIAPLSGLPEWLARGLIAALWGMQALKSLLSDQDMVVLQIERPGYAGAIAIISAHVVVVASLTLLALYWQARACTAVTMPRAARTT